LISRLQASTSSYQRAQLSKTITPEQSVCFPKTPSEKNTKQNLTMAQGTTSTLSEPASPTRPNISNEMRQRKGNNNNNNTGIPLVCPTTPPRLTHSFGESDGDPLVDDTLSPKPQKQRCNSGDYRKDYNMKFSTNDDQTPLLLGQQSGAWWEAQKWTLFMCYVLGVVVLGVLSMMAVSLADSKLGGTVTNILHFCITLWFLHWTKGGYHEDQGELNDMTLWEQIDATENCANLRLAFRVVPLILCYLACLEVGWNAGWKGAWHACVFNCVVCFFSILGKTSFMNGRRLFGINKHPTLHEE